MLYLTPSTTKKAASSELLVVNALSLLIKSPAFISSDKEISRIFSKSVFLCSVPSSICLALLGAKETN